MGWQDEFQRKLMSFEDAARLVQAGDVLFTPIGGDARSFMPALFARVVDLGMNVKIRACSPTPAQEWFNDEFADMGFDVNSEIFAGATARQALAGKRADFYIQLFSNQTNIYDHRDDVDPIDVFVTQAAMPDEKGYIHFGGSPWAKGDFIRRARTSIVELWPFLPNIRTNERIHISEVSAFVMTELPEKPPVAGSQASPETATIAGFVNEIIKDGDTIQIGAGRTATHLVTAGLFAGKHDLGWHSEITPSGIVGAMMDGTMNNSRKSVDRGVGVTTVVAPRTPEEEAWLTAPNCPFETRSVVSVNAIVNVAAQERMCSINNAFTVDVHGQVCSESMGTTVYNGTGGQPEFHIGAFIAPGGKAITVLPASAAGGLVSRIVPKIEDGSYVTIPRSFTDYVVTEYGIARLGGKSQRQRAEEMASIAHPDHRAELRNAARTYFYPSATPVRAD
ncbi:MAG: hypothetical protein O2798_07250 [Chloroflexi bacterium]|nr:hypothetical protein [Chloroflexota bacterium]MDA1240624.1 hypothetical protein [Chloroflexota bacterium]